jgi:hypothetical protein
MTEGYPDPTVFDESLYSRLHMLPNGGAIDLAWIRAHVWSEASLFHFPRSKVVRGMQANMFTIAIEGGGGGGGGGDEVETRSAVAKRIVPKELPAKAGGATIWKEFCESAKREIDFYHVLMEEDDVDSGHDIKMAFPEVFHALSAFRVNLNARGSVYKQIILFVILFRFTTARASAAPLTRPRHLTPSSSS